MKYHLVVFILLSLSIPCALGNDKYGPYTQQDIDKLNQENYQSIRKSNWIPEIYKNSPEDVRLIHIFHVIYHGEIEKECFTDGKFENFLAPWYDKKYKRIPFLYTILPAWIYKRIPLIYTKLPNCSTIWIGNGDSIIGDQDDFYDIYIAETVKKLDIKRIYYIGGTWFGNYFAVNEDNDTFLFTELVTPIEYPLDSIAFLERKLFPGDTLSYLVKKGFSIDSCQVVRVLPTFFPVEEVPDSLWNEIFDEMFWPRKQTKN